jgi:uncharacterized integral membrane protein
MAYQYKRRRPSIIRNFWVYRRLIGSAVLLGLMLWFVWANGSAVTVEFPFRLGQLQSTVGVVILLSALLGCLMTFLTLTVVLAARKIRGAQGTSNTPSDAESVDDRPPPDYAAKTTDGVSNPRWSS